MRELRDSNPESFRFITMRTVEARHWLTPNKKVRKVIGSVLARYSELYNIKLFACAFLSNHFHLLLQAPLGNTDEFMANLNREISRRLNWLHKREGALWGRRYTDIPVLSSEDLLLCFLYINNNPTHHGLLLDSAQWPGLTSYKLVLSEKPVPYYFTHYSKDLDDPQRITKHLLSFSPLPQFKNLKKRDRINTLRHELEAHRQVLVEERSNSGKNHFLGLEGIRQQIPGDKPLNVKKSRRPLCYSKNAERIRQFIAHRKLFRAHYSEASMRYRIGLNADFPPFSYLPPLLRKPRLFPFTPLTIQFFSP